MQLTLGSPIGKGRHRECYIHPENNALCVKIVYSTESGGDKELKRELNYYRHLGARCINWDNLPRYHGEVETNLGIGYAYDLITDFDGNPSKELDFYLRQAQQNADFAWLTPLLVAFKQNLETNQIVTMSLKPKNILVKQAHDGSRKLVVVDNIGEAAIIPAASWNRFFYHRKHTRLWQRFLTLLENYGYFAPAGTF
ncbi:PhoP regulatory network protein YrbL [Paramixta manurensis]|uniref:PhoP regulatory network protein YrbL n=1 Tax=Paramixta manurensis TaxID=2740817 RepID=A0A6M8UL13_9GAMM|nr:PhoP regulatory network protein YrbL [Erwiniaceae bacterium PD-1]